MSNTRRAYSYVRFSSPEQAKGHSLRRQLEATQKYADTHGLELDTSLRDLGRSAYKGDHLKGSLGAFRDAVNAGQVPRGSILIVESLDRLSRAKVPAALSQFIQLIEAGIEIVTLTDGRSYSAEQLNADWTPLIISLAVMSRAHEESATKSSRITDVWERRRASAASKPMTARRPAWLDWQNDKFVVIPERAAIVQRIFNEVAEHGYGLEVMSRRLNHENVPVLVQTKGTPGWHKWSINNILSSRSAYGEFQPMRRLASNKREAAGDAIPGYYPAVVTRDLFNRAQQARALNRGSGGPKTNCVPNMLLGRVFCKECGGKLRVRTNKRRSNSYICDSAFRRAGCTNNVFNAVHWVEQGVMDAVLMFRNNTSSDNHPKAVALREEIAQLGGDIEAARVRMNRLIDAMAEDPIPQVVTRVRELGKQIEAWETRKADAQNELAGVSGQATIGEHIEAVRQLREAAYCEDYHEREAARSKLSVTLRQAIVSVHIGRDRVSHMVAQDGNMEFQITAGTLHDVVFIVQGQRWLLKPEGEMQLVG